MVSRPLHETTQGRPATAIRIPVVLCGAPGVRTKILSTKKKGLDASTDRGLTERSGEVFLLDILSHRMSDMGIYRQSWSVLCAAAAAICSLFPLPCSFRATAGAGEQPVYGCSTALARILASAASRRLLYALTAHGTCLVVVFHQVLGDMSDMGIFHQPRAISFFPKSKFALPSRLHASLY